MSLIIIKTDRNKYYANGQDLVCDEIKDFDWKDYPWANPKDQSFWFDDLIYKIEEDEKHIHTLINTEKLHLLSKINWKDEKEIVQKSVEWSRDKKIENILKK